MDETLWPARNVAEYAYCPRLFYYMEVEGIHLPSADTVEGIRIHARVDEPSRESVLQAATDNDAPKVVRSLALTSPSLGLTATLDLVEVDGFVAIPVEYRKGKPHHIRSEGEAEDAVEPWPTDRIHVGLQAILLEEAGYTVPQAVLYYAAEKRRLMVPVDDALRADSLATLEAAKAGSGSV
jgi:CRISPR-associated protein Cas4